MPQVTRSVARKARRVLFISVLVSFSAFLPWEALGHEEYPWVRQDKYRTPTGGHCCSEAHCRPQLAGEVIKIPGGYRHVPTGGELKEGKPGIYSTEDPDLRPFVCLINGVFVCTFLGEHET